MPDFIPRLLALAQQGLPLVPRPFEAVAQELGVTEEEVINRLEELEDEGIIREFSAFLDPKKLGYQSTLACMKVPEEKINDVAQLLAEMPEITHNYLRDHEYNMWFTVIAPSAEQVEKILNLISAQTGCAPVHNLPAQSMFKIRVAFKADEMTA